MPLGASPMHASDSISHSCAHMLGPLALRAAVAVAAAVAALTGHELAVHGPTPPCCPSIPLLPRPPTRCPPQEKKAAEEARKKELDELFAVAIKQPKVPVGACRAQHTL
jgi:hypothetical protein